MNKPNSKDKITRKRVTNQDFLQIKELLKLKLKPKQIKQITGRGMFVIKTVKVCDNFAGYEAAKDAFYRKYKMCKYKVAATPQEVPATEPKEEVKTATGEKLDAEYIMKKQMELLQRSVKATEQIAMALERMVSLKEQSIEYAKQRNAGNWFRR